MDNTDIIDATDLPAPAPSLQPHTHNGVDSPLIDKKANGVPVAAYAKFALTAAQTISGASGTVVNFDTTIFNTGITVDVVNHRLVCVTPGYYWIYGKLNFTNTVSGATYFASIFLNGTQNAYQQIQASATSQVDSAIGNLLLMVVGDYVDLRGGATSSSPLNVPGNSQNYLLMYKV